MAELKMSKPVARPVAKPKARPVSKPSQPTKATPVKEVVDELVEMKPPMKAKVNLVSKVKDFFQKVKPFKLFMYIGVSIGVVILNILLVLVPVIRILELLANLIVKSRLLLTVYLIQITIPSPRNKFNDTRGEGSKSPSE